MRIFYCDHFVLPLPDGHRFPMAKYSLLRRRVEDAGLGRLQVPEGADDEMLRLVHDARYVERVRDGHLSADEVRRIGFPWSSGLVERSRRSVGGTVAAARAALTDGVAVNLAGGTHHAFPDRGEGFCVFNDVAVASRVVQEEAAARRIAILDLDVHQGNGTAVIFSDDPSVFTLSVHGRHNFPFRKASSDLDLELQDGAGDEAFLDAVERGVAEALSLAQADLAFYVAGADPFEGDRLGRLAVTKAGLKRRDELVYGRCAGAGVPVAVVMSGGYSQLVSDTVDIHFASVAGASGLAAVGPGVGTGP
ncbi:MAG: histone deacetylase [Gemmatimonadota bacterium]|nr:MAG: histone deacetylase [Gemmatimonadota bacterium]